MSDKSEPAPIKIRLVKWAKLAPNQEPPAVNVQQMRLCAIETPTIPVKQEPSRCSTQVKSNASAQAISASVFLNDSIEFLSTGIL